MNKVINQEKMEIKVVAEICLYKREKSAEITAVFTPDAETLANQIDDFFTRIQFRARAVMLQKYTDKLVEISDSGIPSEYEEKTLKVFVFIAFGSGVVHSFSGNEIRFIQSDLIEATIFDWNTLEHAEEKLALELLKRVSKLGGH